MIAPKEIRKFAIHFLIQNSGACIHVIYYMYKKKKKIEPEKEEDIFIKSQW